MPTLNGTRCRAAAAALALDLAAGTARPASAAGRTERVSVGPGNAQGDQPSDDPTLSANGRYVAFESEAGNLVPDDTNGQRDVFVRDRETRRTARVSVGPGGGQGDSASYNPALSVDGRYVAFASRAGNLVPGDTNGKDDVFVHDRRTGRTVRASVGPGGAQGDDHSYTPVPSADGRFVAFASYASNLAPGDTNDTADVFVHDRRTRRTIRASVGPGGGQGDGFSFDPALSADGRFVAFSSDAGNLVPGDTNGTADVFVHDRRTGGTVRASVGSGNAQGDGGSYEPSLSADGRLVAFSSNASNLVAGDTNGAQDVFVRDLRAATTTRASVGPDGAQGGGRSFVGGISAGGRFVAFSSTARNLVPSDTNGAGDVFVRDLKAGTTTRASVGPRGAQGDDWSGQPAISADGRVVGFFSDAGNLVPGDTNGSSDVFVRTR